MIELDARRLGIDSFGAPACWLLIVMLLGSAVAGSAVCLPPVPSKTPQVVSCGGLKDAVRNAPSGSVLLVQSTGENSNCKTQNITISQSDFTIRGIGTVILKPDGGPGNPGSARPEKA